MTTQDYLDWITDPAAQAQAQAWREAEERAEWRIRVEEGDRLFGRPTQSNMEGA